MIFKIIENKQTTKAEPVNLDTDKELILAFAKFASELKNCAGLAANQVGQSFEAFKKDFGDGLYSNCFKYELSPGLEETKTEYSIPILKSFFVINKMIKPGYKEDYKENWENNCYEQLIVVNPKIIKYWGTKEMMKEGCLSWPGKTILARRSRMIDVEYYNIDGKKITKTFDGLRAQIFQHEYDHLMGIKERFEGTKKTGRNEPCPCGSGKKYKKCCWK